MAVEVPAPIIQNPRQNPGKPGRNKLDTNRVHCRHPRRSDPLPLLSAQARILRHILFSRRNLIPDPPSIRAKNGEADASPFCPRWNKGEGTRLKQPSTPTQRSHL